MAPPDQFVFSYNPSVPFLGSSKVGNYLYRYLSAIEMKTYICEADYIDKDYIIDFSKFYARSFDEIPRTTTRYHFFRNEFTQDEFVSAVETKNEGFIENIKKCYLGFCVKKPIEDVNKNPIIGRTLLKTYKKHDNGEVREYLKHSYPASLFGIPLEIETLPFQQKDNAVSACATVACWTSLFPLMNLFGVQTLSPSEITELSTLFPSDARNYPSEGLTIYQIKQYFNSLGLETEFIDPDDSRLGLIELHPDDDIVAIAVRAYIELGLPIIAALHVVVGGEITDYHAVVISGYRHNRGKIIELYTHDDNIGPYHFILPDETGKFLRWQESGEEGKHYLVDRLLIPVYPKLRLSFSKIFPVYIQYRHGTYQLIRGGSFPEGTITELLLMDIQHYKKFLLEEEFDNKIEILTQRMPRFLWIIRVSNHDRIFKDYIFDGTAVFARGPILGIDFL